MIPDQRRGYALRITGARPFRLRRKNGDVAASRRAHALRLLAPVARKRKNHPGWGGFFVSGADYGARTRHLDLGKVALYQMS